MHQILIEKPEIKLIGICVRTSHLQEIDKMKGHIFPCVQRYFHQALFEKIPKRIKPGTTYCAYTNYESDHQGVFTYFIGEEVSSFESPLPDGLQPLVIPKQYYTKFTTSPSPMPDVIVNAWQRIEKMSSKELMGARSYQADFEVYDERASDHQNIVLDVYVGIHPVQKIEYVKRQDSVKHEHSQNCIAYEYPMKNSEMNIGIVEIKQRYPDCGFAINYKCTEMGYVLKGSGSLVTQTQNIALTEGDVIYVPHGEKYYWEGNITLVVPATPSWYLEQHAVLPESD